MAKVLSIVPYKFLPPANGGHWGVIIVEKILAVFNEVHTVSLQSNSAKSALPFHTHFILSAGKLRYLPFSRYNKVLKLAKTIKPDYIFCHHHYMFPMAKRIAVKLKTPLYIRCHNIEAERFKDMGKWWWKAMRIFEKIAYKNADRVFFVTSEDCALAVKNYKLDVSKTTVMPFGIKFEYPPQMPEKTKEVVALEYDLNPHIPWLFFMGQLDYEPNEEAVQFIIEDIFPLLQQKVGAFHLLICGKGLSTILQQKISTSSENRAMAYLGFVPEIEPVIAACDLMINPVLSGGGVKTKVVESLAWNKTVVSTHSGAIGIERSVCGNKLLIAPDEDWMQFVILIQKALSSSGAPVSKAFYDFYYARNIAERIQPYFSN